MKTVAQVQLLDGGTAEVAYEWDVQPGGKQLLMSIDAAIPSDDGHCLCWEDQFALLDTAWLILVDLRRAARKQARRAKNAEPSGVMSLDDWRAREPDSPRLVGGLKL